MFDAFMKRFGSKTKSKFYSHMINEDVRVQLFSILYENYPEAFGALMDSWREIMEDALKESEENQKKALEKIGELFNKKGGVV